MGLNIVVCIKAVVMNPPEGRLDQPPVRSSGTCELNPYDRPALEAAIRLRDLEGGMVTAVSMGPSACGFALREAISLGADRGIMVCDPLFSGSDTLASSTVLAAAIRKLSPVDLVLFGTRAADSDTGQVGPQTAVGLGLPIVTGVKGMERTASGLRVERRLDGFIEAYEIDFPSALTLHPSAFPARDAPLAGIEAAFRNNIETWGFSDLRLTPADVGLSGSPTRVLSMKRVVKERKCRFLSGMPGEQVEALVRHLEESGVVG
jgi:electron transfer flavoprotein beta subunit